MLYIVGTPIGNMEDISFRQARTLSEAEVILTEDTRTTHYLLKKIQELFHVSLKEGQVILSYHKDNEFEKLSYVLELLDEEKNVALISQAGMPLINDPGGLLVKTAVKKNIPFTIIPGPSAVTTNLLSSGFTAKHFMFIGFLPKKRGEVINTLERLKKIKELDAELVFIFFESPNRIKETLGLISEYMPAASLHIGRELTKKFEEHVRGSASELLKREYKGEITVTLK